MLQTLQEYRFPQTKWHHGLTLTPCEYAILTPNHKLNDQNHTKYASGMSTYERNFLTEIARFAKTLNIWYCMRTHKNLLLFPNGSERKTKESIVITFPWSTEVATLFLWFRNKTCLALAKLEKPCNIQIIIIYINLRIGRKSNFHQFIIKLSNWIVNWIL